MAWGTQQRQDRQESRPRRAGSPGTSRLTPWTREGMGRHAELEPGEASSLGPHPEGSKWGAGRLRFW